MELDINALQVVDNPQEKRLEINLGNGDYAFVEYQPAGPNIIYTHTEVPEKYEGMGVGGKLANAAMEHAKEHGLKVQPLCPFIKAYVARHPEYHSMSWGF